MGIGTAIMTCLEKFLIFQGRARRSEFWWFYAFTILVGLLAIPIDMLLETEMISTGVGVAFLLPTLAAGTRRLHDTGRPGYYLALPFLALPLFYFGPAIGGLTLLICMALLILLLCLPGHLGNNRYGPDPRLLTDSQVFE
ncbi:MAG: DUF805 domain-containing protein [Pseudomonadota bacterium]